jgi:mono/diheme cytochrome c family protein
MKRKPVGLRTAVTLSAAFVIAAADPSSARHAYALETSAEALFAQASPSKADGSAPEASPTDIDGPTLFATLCGFCHENGGRTAGKGPKLAGTKRSDEYIVEKIKKGKPGAMPGFGASFSDGQIVAILAYIRGLDDTEQ